jgi:hypothetical protein
VSYSPVIVFSISVVLLKRTKKDSIIDRQRSDDNRENAMRCLFWIVRPNADVSTRNHATADANHWCSSHVGRRSSS